ncbi:hypothetical protein B566_EDAN008419 [Ephemera danica]|nr:hypothetical protein B566_EDAN008419 [Ephemera danica]
MQINMEWNIGSAHFFSRAHILFRLLRWQNLSNLQILDALLRQYDRRATPTNNQGIPTEVHCDIFIRSFGSINPSTMDYQVDLYLQQTWVDWRLRNKHLTRALDLNDPNLVQRIWKPEVFFANAKHAEFQYVTVPNVLIRVAPDGKILYMLSRKTWKNTIHDFNGLSNASNDGGITEFSRSEQIENGLTSVVKQPFVTSIPESYGL